MLNFQTIIDLTGMDIANASMLDEGHRRHRGYDAIGAPRSAARNGTSLRLREVPQTIDVMRAPEPLAWPGSSATSYSEFGGETFAAARAVPRYGRDDRGVRRLLRCGHAGALVIVATDLLALTLLTPPGDLPTVAVGNSQRRFGVP